MIGPGDPAARGAAAAPRRRARPAAVAALGLVALSACAQGPAAPVARAPGHAVDVDVDSGRLVLEAGGRDVIVAPPAGLCVGRDGVQGQGGASFVLIEDCAFAGDVSDQAAPAQDPIVMRGLVMLSVGDAPLFPEGEARRAATVELERFLRSDEGRASAGIGGDASEIRILATRSLPDALYVLVEDDGPAVSPLLGPRIWRAFTELNGRAAIASLGVFETASLGDAAMLAHLARVVAALKMANGEEVSVESARLALAAPLPRRRPERSGRISAGGVSAPLPPARPGGNAQAVAVLERRLSPEPAAAPAPILSLPEAPASAPHSPPRAARG